MLSAGALSKNYQDLRYVQRRFIDKDQLSKVIATIIFSALLKYRWIRCDLSGSNYFSTETGRISASAYGKSTTFDQLQ